MTDILELFHQHIRIPLIVLQLLSAGRQCLDIDLLKSLFNKPVRRAGGEGVDLLHPVFPCLVLNMAEQWMMR